MNMKRMMMVWVMILCLVPLGGWAEKEKEGIQLIDPKVRSAAEDLSSYGYDVPESVQGDVAEWYHEILEELGNNPFFIGMYEKPEYLRFMLLWKCGAGIYDYDTGHWTPTSDKVYAFDAEVFDIEHMYTLFLMGVQSIVQDITITDITEDLAGMNEELDGTRSVSFLCNGHTYRAELTSMGDWIDGSILPFMNQVLEQENCQYRLFEIQDPYDQMIILIYDTPGKAVQMKMFVDYRR